MDVVLQNLAPSSLSGCLLRHCRLRCPSSMGFHVCHNLTPRKAFATNPTLICWLFKGCGSRGRWSSLGTLPCPICRYGGVNCLIGEGRLAKHALRHTLINGGATLWAMECDKPILHRTWCRLWYSSLTGRRPKSVHMRFIHLMPRIRRDCAFVHAASVPMLCGLI